MNLKTTTTKVAISIFIIALTSIFMSEYFAPAGADNPNPPANFSGSPADNQRCTSCHGSANTTYTVSLTGLPNNGYISGKQYTMTLTMTSGLTSNIAYGFEISPQTTSTTKTFIGTLQHPTNLTRSPATGYVTNTSKQGGNTASYTWTYQWTAPGGGNQTGANATSNKAEGNFYGCFMFADNNGQANSGDHPKITSFPITENVTASVNLAASATTICSGSSVTFTITPTNEGTSPTYQIQVNGTTTYTTTGAGSPGFGNTFTYTTSSLNNGDVVTCILTSSKTGVSGSPATSNSITMTVDVTPTVIGTTPDSRCGTGTVVLGATASSGTINWYSGSSGGSSLATGTSYTTTSISSTTTYYVDATNNGCTTSSRTAVTATVNAVPATPTAGSNSPVCEGDNILLNSSSSTSSVSYNWNGPNSYTSSSQNPAISSATQAMAGTYSVTATLNGCISNVGSTTVVVNAPLAPVASIAVTGGSNTTCSGQAVTFSVTPTNGGSSPTYQWLVNGLAAPGTNNASTYTSSSFSDKDSVACVLTSNANCISKTTDTSNVIKIVITPKDVPTVSIQITNGDNQICTGQLVEFAATPAFGGSSPAYQWQVNGVNVGTGTDTLQTKKLNNNDEVKCILTSNANCITTATATSNTITMVVTGIVSPSISILETNGSNPSCEGSSVTFTASASGGGSSPTYQWKLDGNIVGSNSTTYTTASLTNGQEIACELTSSSSCASPQSALSNTITMTITSTVIPSVSISGSGSICSGAVATFTATPTNGGSNPSFQWKVNGVDAGSGSTFSSSSLANNENVVCVLTADATACANPSGAASNTITMVVTPVANPGVSVAITGGANPSCLGQTVTFSVTPTDEGSSPAYQWKVNGGNVGTSTTYSSSSLNDNDNVTCVLTSNAACASTPTVSSTPIVMSILSTFTPSLTISGTTSICSGQSVTFTANPYGGGSSPSYHWELDGSPVGSNSQTYGPVALSDGQVITCTLTSSSSCASQPTASSNALTMQVTPTVTPSVSISGINTICSGTVVTFTASSTNEGLNPSYQWKLNGSPVGSNSNVYTSSNNLANNSIISCVLTSNAACASPATATATPITMNVTPVVNPSVSLNFQSGSNPRCSSDPITFQALINHGGSSPSYQWSVNGNSAPGATNSDTYSPSSLNNNDVITCVLSSNALCASSATVSSTPITMSVTTAITPSVTINTSSTTVNAGAMVTFTATPTYGGSNPTYQWKIDGSFIGGPSSDIFSTNTLTSGQVISCVLTSDYACKTQAMANSNTITMIVTPTASPAPPTITKTITNIDVLLTSSASSGNQWYYNGVLIPGATAKTYTATKNGVYYVVYTNNNNVALQSAPMGVAVPVNITQNDTLLTSSSAIGNQWYLDGIAIPDSTGQTIIATQNGYYSVVVTINGVSSTSSTPVLINSFSSSPTNIGQIQNDDSITISPSPNDGNFKISFNVNVNATYILEIKNMLGQLVYSEVLTNFSGTYDKQLNLSGFGKSVYVVSLTSAAYKSVNILVVY